MSWPVGPTDTELSVYETLVDRGSLTASEIASTLRLNEEEATHLLESLHTQRLATRGPAGIFAATAPDLALGSILAQHTEQIGRVRTLIEDLDRRYRRRSTSDDVERTIEVVRGRDAVIQHADHVMSSAKSSIWAIAEEIDFRLQPEEGYHSLLAALERSVDHRVLVRSSALAYPEALERIRMARGPSSRHRAVSSVPTRLLIVDETLAVMPVQSTGDVEGAVLHIRSSPILTALIGLFHELWSRGRPIGLDDEGLAGTEELSQDDIAILSLLINGLTNASIATQLELSPRTVQRRVHSFMQRTGAKSRVQLGYEAGLRGWLAEERQTAS